MKKITLLALGAISIFLLASHGMADGIPQPKQLGFQTPASPVKEKIHTLHEYMLYTITVITAFVTLLLAVVIVRFNSKANPTPSTTTHNTTLEIVWTAIPVLILIAIAIPSLKLLYFMDKAQEADMTLKVVGRQWYWSYEYPDQAGIKFDSYLIEDKDLKAGQIRLLEVDNPVVVPVGKTVRVLVTGADVIHNWYVPALGVNIAANPGRTNETWFKAEKEGVYYGQCAQLCGVRHGFMPIKIEVVSDEKFKAWVEDAKKKFASLDFSSPVQFTSNEQLAIRN